MQQKLSDEEVDTRIFNRIMKYLAQQGLKVCSEKAQIPKEKRPRLDKISCIKFHR